jgi:hypothetical protein
MVTSLFRFNGLADGTGEDTGNQYMADFNFTYNSEEPGRSDYFVEFSSRVNDASLIMFSIKEAYMSSADKSADYTWKAGRSKLEWSKLDEVWGFGKINNRVNFDFFEPGQEGLTGYVGKQKIGLASIEFFGSAIYIPELNPSLDIDIDKGTITSRHPWVKPPPATTDQGSGEETPIFYDVAYPDIAEIVLNYSIGAKLSIETQNVVADAFAIRKPDNTIAIGADPKVDPTGSPIVVRIEPGVIYSNTAGGTLKFRNKDKNFEVYGSYLYSQPDDVIKGDQDFFDITQYKHVRILEEYGGFGMARIGQTSKISLNYIARRSRLEETDDNPLEVEPRWNEAINVSYQKKWNDRLSSLFDIKIDTFSYDRLFTFDTSYNFNNDTVLSAGFNIIGSNDTEQTFWSPFRNNDSVYSKLSVRF